MTLKEAVKLAKEILKNGDVEVLRVLVEHAEKSLEPWWYEGAKRYFGIK